MSSWVGRLWTWWRNLGVEDRAFSSAVDPASASRSVEPTEINPATGLPMIGGVDVAGSPYGTDLHEDDHTYSSHDGSDSSSDPWS